MSQAPNKAGKLSSRSLVSQISFMVLGGITITAMVVSFIYVTVASTGLQGEINRRHQILSKKMAIIIETAWRQDNDPYMIQAIDSLLSDGDITLVRIIDKDGDIIFSSNAHKTGVHHDALATEINLTVPISNLGQLELSASNESQNLFVRGMIWKGLIATILVTAIVFAIVRRRLLNVTQELATTVSAAESMREGQFELGLGLSGHSEIDSLRTSLNETGHRLRQLTNDLQHQVPR